MRKLENSVAVVVGPYHIEDWLSYEIVNDMLSPADSFELTAGPFTNDLYRALLPDSEVQVFLDDTRILTGLIDERRSTSSKGQGTQLVVRGRDRGGRLLDERCPLFSLVGLGILDLAKKCTDPWVTNVTASNATNRRLIAGGAAARMGRISKEPAIEVIRESTNIFGHGSDHRRKVRPGESRWQVLAHFLEETKLLAWPTADGSTLVVGQPNYNQEPTFHFVHAKPQSQRAADSNVESIEVVDNFGERYSRIICMADDVEPGGGAVRHYKGEVFDGVGPDGEGRNFIHPKVMIIHDSDVKSNAMAQARAEREMAERDGAGHELVVTVRGHSQVIAGGKTPTLYAFDTIARVTSEDFGIDADYLITRTRFTLKKDSGPVTELHLVPKGTTLVT